jgi:hypothetical protein
MQDRERAAVVVTCRREEYQALTPGVDKATHIEMVPLDGRGAADYVAGQLRGPEEEQAWEPVLKRLRADPGGPLAAQLATPWRLTLALTVFRDGGTPSELLPGPVLDPYAQRINTLLLDRYVPSAVRLQDPGGNHAPDQVQRFLTAMAKDLDWQAHHNGSATDIELDKWWRPVGRRAAPFTHIVLVSLIAVPWLAVGGGSNLFVAASILLLAAAAGIPQPMHRIEPRQLTNRNGLMKLGLGLGFGLGGGIALGLILAYVTGDNTWIPSMLISFLAFGLAGGLAIALNDPSPQAFGPREVIRADGQFGLAVVLAIVLVGGLPIGVTIGFFAGPMAGFTSALPLALTYGLAAGLSYGASAWTRYHIAMVIAAIRRSGPLRIGAALEWAYQAGLLRLSGVAYQFRHRQLQDWLRSEQ